MLLPTHCLIGPVRRQKAVISLGKIFPTRLQKNLGCPNASTRHTSRPRSHGSAFPTHTNNHTYISPATHTHTHQSPSVPLPHPYTRIDRQRTVKMGFIPFLNTVLTVLEWLVPLLPGGEAATELYAVIELIKSCNSAADFKFLLAHTVTNLAIVLADATLAWWISTPIKIAMKTLTKILEQL